MDILTVSEMIKHTVAKKKIKHFFHLPNKPRCLATGMLPRAICQATTHRWTIASIHSKAESTLSTAKKGFMILSNPELELAGAYMRETGTHLFLTGKAGTGKTTFLRHLKDDCAKRMVVTAPTGVAAINAGGVTLHSFFQLPFGPFLGDTDRGGASRYRFSREKTAIIKSLDLLIIDEISMVRADLLDGVDHVLRRLRRSTKPFGGAQLLMIGDLHQLPPVVKSNEWQLLSDRYESPYFFSSHALGQSPMTTIELSRIFRQSDDDFIDILNRVRDDRLDGPTLAHLNSRVENVSAVSNKDGYITLCTHNSKADAINSRELGGLPSPLHIFPASVEGDFPEHTYPAAAGLKLKKGAQVMFIRNDPSPEKRYFNGKIGTVTGIAKDSVLVSCPEETGSIEVSAATWENIEYSLDRQKQEIVEKKIGSFSQFPLRLAWAITIHKSQGLTFDNAVIDAQAAFAHGQVYVALSRCRSLGGLKLTAPIEPRMLKTDGAILDFTTRSRNASPTAEKLKNEKVAYQQRLILECFDCDALRSLLRRMIALINGNRDLLQLTGIADTAALQHNAEKEIFAVAANFQKQLRSIFQAATPAAEDPRILERLAKASAYFQEKLTTVLITPMAALELETDNRELEKKCCRLRQLLAEESAVKLAAVRCCSTGFSPADYFRAVAAASVAAQKPPKKKEPLYSEADIAHPEVFQSLKEWRTNKAAKENVPAYQVLHQKTLVQIAVNLPDTLTDLQKIKGIGDKLTKRYGDELVAMVADYRRRHGIEDIQPPPPSTVESPQKAGTTGGDTKKTTLELFRRGLTIEEIVLQRRLSRQTIDKHIAHLIQKAEIEVDSVMPAEKASRLLQQIEEMTDKKLRQIKESLDEECSYGEILFILAHIQRASTS